ncbi:MAG: SxtJ family membrane protein [Gemmatimonadales bacterium]|nr:SxtJ family membrane protein [Gemmatimonadales bacterium]
MAHQVPARLSPAEGRKFGVQVGLAFCALAAIVLWRGKTDLASVLGGLGAALVVAGLIIPGLLGPVYRAWMGLALVLSKVTTPIFMGIVYFVVLTPIGLVMRAFGKNPLRHDVVAGSNWALHDRRSQAPGSMERQF